MKIVIQPTHAFIKATFLLALLSMIPAITNAQTPGLKPKLYLGGGVAALNNPSALEAIYATKYSLVAAVGLPFSVGIEVMGKLHYHRFGIEEYWETLGANDPNLKLITFGLDAKWAILPPPIPARPYVLVGVGRFSRKQEEMKVGNQLILARNNNSDVFFNIGVGLDVALGPNFALFAEIKHTILNQQPESLGILPIVIGARIL